MKEDKVVKKITQKKDLDFAVFQNKSFSFEERVKAFIRFACPKVPGEGREFSLNIFAEFGLSDVDLARQIDFFASSMGLVFVLKKERVGLFKREE